MKPGKDIVDNHLTRAEVVTGTAVLICAQLAAASTASCVKALPIETPSVLRGLWRQTLTSFIFSVFTLMLYLRDRKKCSDLRKSAEESVVLDESTRLLSKPTSEGGEIKTDNGHTIDAQEAESFLGLGCFSAAHVALVSITVIGATLLNDTIVIALRYASSAAVMCLCNTSELN